MAMSPCGPEGFPRRQGQARPLGPVHMLIHGVYERMDAGELSPIEGNDQLLAIADEQIRAGYATYERDRALILLSRVDILMEENDPEGALAAQVEAVELLQVLVVGGDPQIAVKHANTRRELGWIRHLLGDAHGAGREFATAIQTLKALHAGGLEVEDDLAYTHLRHAEVLAAADDDEGALAEAQLARRKFDRLSRREPELRMHLADTCETLAGLLDTANRTEEALEAARESVPIYSELEDFRSELAAALDTRANILRPHDPAALRDCQRAESQRDAASAPAAECLEILAEHIAAGRGYLLSDWLLAAVRLYDEGLADPRGLADAASSLVQGLSSPLPSLVLQRSSRFESALPGARVERAGSSLRSLAASAV